MNPLIGLVVAGPAPGTYVTVPDMGLSDRLPYITVRQRLDSMWEDQYGGVADHWLKLPFFLRWRRSSRLAEAAYRELIMAQHADEISNLLMDLRDEFTKSFDEWRAENFKSAGFGLDPGGAFGDLSNKLDGLLEDRVGISRGE